jgi:hypothetical protein
MAAKKKSVKSKTVSRKDLHETAPKDVSSIIKKGHDFLEAFIKVFPYPNGTSLEASGSEYLSYTPSARSQHAATVRAIKKALEQVNETAKVTKVFE